MKNKMTGSDNKLALLDEDLRKLIADYYFTLKEMKNPEMAIKLLADHVTILIEMINDIKSNTK